MNFVPNYVTIHWCDFEASLARAFPEITRWSSISILIPISIKGLTYWMSFDNCFRTFFPARVSVFLFAR